MKENVYFLIIEKRLCKKQFDIIDAIGIFGIVIIKKEFYKKNKEVGEILNRIFNIDLPQYIIKSRTLMAARTIRILINNNDKEIQECLSKLRYEIKSINDEEDRKQHSIKKNKNNENKKLEKWLKGL